MGLDRDQALEAYERWRDYQPEPKVSRLCENCSSEIYQGEIYYDYDGMDLCEECMDKFLAEDKYYAERSAE